MSLRWIRNVVVDDRKSTLEVHMGERCIGDKCYTRVGKETEQWFENRSDVRDEVLARGIEILRKRLAGSTLTYPDGRPYDWK
jgi:hypothetical protein